MWPAQLMWRTATHTVYMLDGRIVTDAEYLQATSVASIPQ
jgi:hypothetical protein